MSADKPNILMILTDDQGEWAMGCSGNGDVKTPVLDSLATNGIRFSNFFCTSPVCSPARASFLTGKIPSAHGVHDWLRGGNISIDNFPSLKTDPIFSSESTAIRYLDAQVCYTDLLAQNGYTCALSGKWHLGDSVNPQHGFSNWYTIARGGCDYYHADVVEDGNIYYEQRYVTDVITDNALKNLAQFSTDNKPFYLSVHYTAPHSPWDEKNHPKKFLDLYRDCAFKATPDLSLHLWQDLTAHCGTGEKRKELLRGYYAAISAMDANVGRLLDFLRDNNTLDDTIVIFASDNGMNMGHHGIWGKGNGTFPQNMFDTSVKIPFIMSCPSRFAKETVCDAMLSQYDFLPTLADYLGIAVPSAECLPGRSFADILRGETFEQDSDVVIFDEYGPVRMIRTCGWKLVRRYPYGPNELYCLHDDPQETSNLFGQPQSFTVQQDLSRRMEGWFTRYVNPLIDGVREPVTGKGQLCRVGVFSNGNCAHAEIEDFWRKER